MSGFGNAPRYVIESDTYANPFQDVLRKAKVVRDRAHEDWKRLEEIREERSIAEATSALKRRDWLVPSGRE